jgi:hypothetical protein
LGGLEMRNGDYALIDDFLRFGSASSLTLREDYLRLIAGSRDLFGIESLAVQH